MVRFGDDDGGTPDVDPTDLLALFGALDRKASHVTLRRPQEEALAALTSRRATRDLVLKMSTGYGKTSVALIYLYSFMLEEGAPGVFLCPTVQLVNQVLKEAENLGIKAHHYASRQPHPHTECVRGEAVIVCTYDKLFNAKTTFQRQDVDIVPCAIVLDDAHSGIQEVRSAFTLRITQEEQPTAFDELCTAFASVCKEHQPGVWHGISQHDGDAMMEIPFWSWTPLVAQVQPILEARYREEESDKKSKKAMLFKWGYLRDHLRWCRCIVSGKAIEIFPDVSPVQLAKPFADASHRLFMSATLSDDSALVRELGCAADAAINPIVPPSDAGVGERMILAPSLISSTLDRDWVMRWCESLAKVYRVVVLTASEKVAREWERVNAEVFIGEDVQDAVDNLKNGTLRFAVFAQRYDGVDLPDDACRVLVLDGAPIGQGLGDDYDRPIPGRTGGIHRRQIHRIEQGMGRAVRSQVDYAVIVMTGPDLINFLAKREVTDQMGTTTRAQIKAAEKLTKMARTDARKPETIVHETAMQALTRDRGWRNFYEKNVKKAASAVPDTPDATQVTIASLEQRAQKAAMSRDAPRAAQLIDEAVKMASSEEQKGWLLQRFANYTYDFEPSRALQTQQGAFAKNSRLSIPPHGVAVRKVKPSQAGGVVLAWYNTFDHPNGVVAELARVKPSLSFGVKPKILEQGLSELAVFFGATGSRPEQLYRRGPDDLWEWPTIAWVIEAKNDRGGKLPKVDSGQLHDSLEWYKEHFPETPSPVPVVVAKTASAEYDANFPNGTRVMTAEKLLNLLTTVEQFVVALTQREPILWTVAQVDQLLISHKLDLAHMQGAYTQALTK
ncbi:MAG TPA: DEAD/DEAH box helicase [Kofleriaceae bacterium]